MMMAHRLTRELLQTFVPINALSAERLEDLIEGQQVLYLPPGSVLCEAGERDNFTYFLLSGQVALSNDEAERILNAEDAEASYPIAPAQPRRFTIKAKTGINVLRFDSKRFDRVLAWDQSSVNLERELADLMPVSEDIKWIGRLLKSKLFYRIPPYSVIELFRRLERTFVKAGAHVVERGATSDRCYFIQEGTVLVSITEAGRQTELARLGPGQYFGEEGLLTDGPRNADITMLTEGVLLALEKRDFDELLKMPSVAVISAGDGAGMVEQAQATWLDVRTSEEYAHGTLRGAVKLPLPMLRRRAAELPNDRHYIVYCDTGNRATAAAFMLGVMGFNVLVLEGGLEALSPTARRLLMVSE